MPELPEVETIKRDLERKLIGCTIKSVDVYDDRVLKQSRTFFKKQIINAQIKTISRRAKAIIFSTQPQGFLVVQLGMTGQLIYGKNFKKEENLKDTKVVFSLSNGQYLNYNDQRMFGKLNAVKNLEEVSYFKQIGTEPLGDNFSVDGLKKILKNRKMPLKTFLMNQQFVVGIGNIYASEILFSAGLNPKKAAAQLKENEIQLLHKATIKILKEAIHHRGTSMRNYRDAEGQKGKFNNRIKVYDREKESCFTCESPIQKIVQSGRSTFFCKKCQH